MTKFKYPSTMDGSVYSDEQMSSLDGIPLDRLDDLERKVANQETEIALLKSFVTELLRRIADLESGLGRPRSTTLSASTLNLPTKSTLSRTRPAAQNVPPSPGPLSSRSRSTTHHLSTESLQSNYTPNRPSSRTTDSGSTTTTIRNSTSIDRLATPRGSLASSRNNTMTLPPPSKTAPMRKWTSNSDFQSDNNSQNHNNHSPAPNSTASLQRRSFGGSQNQLTPAAKKEPVFNPDDGYLHVSIRGKGINFYVPSEDCLTQSLTKVNPAPKQRLKLDWVYGYRGRDCRSNLFFVATGEACYFIASVVVLVNLGEETQRHYVGHSDEIRCIAVHPNKCTVASGPAGSVDRKTASSTRRTSDSPTGEKMAHVRVWDVISLNTLHVIGVNGEFEKGITNLAFSKTDGGALLCIIDESAEHTLCLWDWQRTGAKGERLSSVASGTEAAFACEFHPTIGNLLITCGKNHMYFWTLDGHSFVLNRNPATYDRADKPKYTLSLCFGENGDIVTGDSNGSIVSWGTSGNRARQIASNAHAGGVFVLFSTSNGLILSAGKDRRVVAWDSTLRATGQQYEMPENFGSTRAIAQSPDQSFLLGTSRNCILQGDLGMGFNEVVHGHFDEIWALATHPNHNQFATASYDHCLTLWSAAEKRPVWKQEMPDGVHAVCFHPDGDLIAVATISGTWHVLDSLTQEMVYSATVAESSQDLLPCIKYSPDGRFLAVASVDRGIYIYQVLEGGSKAVKLGRCTGHSSAVLCLDWSADSQYLRSNSDNFELIYWNPAILKQITNAALCRDVEWDSCNCILEYSVAGVWSDAVQALSVDSSQSADDPSGPVLAVGDDSGKVKLFNFPAMSLKSQCHSYAGHSNHVSSVRFLHDRSQLISSGGRDAAILQWAVVST